MEPLTAALTDWDEQVRRAAAEALGRIGDLRATAALVAALRDQDGDVREAAAEALDALGWGPADAAERAIRAVALRRWEEAARLGAPAVEPLVAVLEDRALLVREASAEALGRIGDARAVGPLVATLRDSGRPENQDKVAVAQGFILPPPHGERVILSPEHAELRRRLSAARKAATEALGRIGGPEAAHALVAALRDEDYAVRRTAAEALGRPGDVRAVGPLLAALTDPTVRGAAAEALGRIGDVRAVGPLVAALPDGDPDVRRTAAQALDMLGWEPAGADQRALRAVALQHWEEATRLGTAAVEPLLAALRHWKLRGAAAKALGQIGDVRAVEPLLAALTDWDEMERGTAVEALGRIGDARAIEPLARAARYGHPARQAVSALERLLERAASNATPEALHAAARVEEFVRRRLAEQSDGWQDTYWRHWPGTVDASRVGQLARQELMRRGLET